MAIQYADFINDGESTKIRANDIATEKEYISKYKNHLFCSETGCNAKIDLAHRSGIPYFRTWKNSKHSKDCMYSFDTYPGNGPTKDGTSILTLLSEKHIKMSLQSSNRKRKIDEGFAQKRSNKNQTTDKKRKSTRPIRLIASVDPSAENISERVKEPRIPQRTCDDILISDIGRTILVRGYVSRAIVTEDSVIYLYDTKNEQQVRILFFSRFKDNSVQAYNWICEQGKDINDNHTVYVSCVGLVEQEHDDVITIQIMNSIALTIDGKALPRFAHNIDAE